MCIRDRNYGRLDNPDKAEYNYVKDVDYISGAAILLPHWLWKQIGGFDERFTPAYCEDSELAFEVRKAGYRVVYQPLSKVIHFEGVSNGTDVNGTGLKRYQVENSQKLKEKWAEEFKKQCVNTGNPNPFRARERSQGKKIIPVSYTHLDVYKRQVIDIILLGIIFYGHIKVQGMHHNLIILPGNNGAICIFIDGAPNDSPSLLLAEGSHICASPSEAYSQRGSSSDYHTFLLFD